jgi:hypothetical protein
MLYKSVITNSNNFLNPDIYIYDIVLFGEEIDMNNTKTKTLAIVAVLTAAILVVGVTATQTALASSRGDDDKNGNTVTILIAKNKAYASGWDTKVNQEAENTICTHPNDECVSEDTVK